MRRAVQVDPGRDDPSFDDRAWRARRTPRRRESRAREMRKTDEANAAFRVGKNRVRRLGSRVSHRDFRPLVRSESIGLEYLLCCRGRRGKIERVCLEMNGNAFRVSRLARARTHRSNVKTEHAKRISIATETKTNEADRIGGRIPCRRESLAIRREFVQKPRADSESAIERWKSSESKR